MSQTPENLQLAPTPPPGLQIMTFYQQIWYSGKVLEWARDNPRPPGPEELTAATFEQQGWPHDRNFKMPVELRDSFVNMLTAVHHDISAYDQAVATAREQYDDLPGRLRAFAHTLQDREVSVTLLDETPEPGTIVEKQGADSKPYNQNIPPGSAVIYNGSVPRKPRKGLVPSTFSLAKTRRFGPPDVLGYKYVIKMVHDADGSPAVELVVHDS